MGPLYFKADKLKMAKPDRMKYKNQNTTKVDKINELFHVNTTQFYIELGKTTS